MVKYFFEESLDIELIQNTFRKAFGKELDIDYWKWRFEDNPNHEKIYISYVLDNNILAAYYAVSPCTVEIEGKGAFKIALSNMTMTHPDYQGRRYFKVLAKELFYKLTQDDFIGIYGFANSYSHYGFRKYLNWIDLAALNIFKVDKSSFRDLLGGKKDVYQTEIQSIDLDILEFCSRMKFKTANISLSRNLKNLRWRFLDNPSQRYYALKILSNKLLCSVFIFKSYFKEIDLMEIFIDPNFIDKKDNFLGLGIYKLLQMENIVNFWSNLFSSEHLLLEKLGFVESNFSSYFGIVPLTADPQLQNIKNWHFRFMDSDIF